MKTIEEKARAYDEAIENMRKFCNALNNHGELDLWVLKKEIVTDIEYYFPELRESEDERIRKELIKHLRDGSEGYMPAGGSEDYARWLAWLEKQGKQEQLYIRFGEIPTDEKSKIYRGEAEVGTENGVSVYPAFKTSEGNIVLGLNLPITKTTLYTQQHLIEYDDRPCYLVKGDYVGKDTDGQPLINNVSIIEKIGTYRVKEEKQSEQKPTDEIEPKFKIGDWIVDKSGLAQQVLDFRGGIYTCTYNSFTTDCESNYHLWTIQDAKDGDVLASEDKDKVFIYNGKLDLRGRVCAYCGIYKTYDGLRFTKCAFGNYFTYKEPHPATKEQRDTLLKAMADAGYIIDFEKKELKKIEHQPLQWNISDYKTWQYIVSDVLTKYDGIGQYLDDGFCKKIAQYMQEIWSKKLSLGENLTWSKEDEANLCQLKTLFEYLAKDIKHEFRIISDNDRDKYTAWLKSLKGRVQPKQEWSEEDEYMLDETIQHLKELIEIDKAKYCACDVQYYQRDIDWLKSLKPQKGE